MNFKSCADETLDYYCIRLCVAVVVQTRTTILSKLCSVFNSVGLSDSLIIQMKALLCFCCEKSKQMRIQLKASVIILDEMHLFSIMTWRPEILKRFSICVSYYFVDSIQFLYFYFIWKANQNKSWTISRKAIAVSSEWQTEISIKNIISLLIACDVLAIDCIGLSIRYIGVRATPVICSYVTLES